VKGYFLPLSKLIPEAAANCYYLFNFQSEETLPTAFELKTLKK